jgi:transcriptional regulator with XRE-family HTH domain
MNDIRDVLAENLKKFRRARGWSQAKLAEKAGTSTQYVGMIETKSKFPSAEMIHNLAKALVVDPTELFYRETSLAKSMRNCQKAALVDVGGTLGQLLQDYVTEKLRELEAAET